MPQPVTMQQRDGQTPTAARMRRLRDRRKRGYRCATIEVADRDGSTLVVAGYLDRERADNVTAIEAAIGAVLDRLAGYP